MGGASHTLVRSFLGQFEASRLQKIMLLADMSLVRVVLLFLTALPALGYAQTADAPVHPPDPLAAPPLIQAPSEPERPPQPLGEVIPRPLEAREGARNLLVPRLLLGPLLGTVASAGGGYLSFLLVQQQTSCDLLDGGCGDQMLLSAPPVLAGWVLSSLTVYAGGNVLNGQGRLLATLAGSFAGMGLGLLALNVTWAWGVLLLPPLAALGATVGYELSHALWRSEPEQAARTPLAVRLPVELLAGAAAGALSATVGLSLTRYLVGYCLGQLWCDQVADTAMAVGILAGTPLGIYSVGRAMGGEGTYLAALLGIGMGTIAGFGSAWLLAHTSEGLALASYMSLPLLGAVAGYELAPRLFPQYFRRKERSTTEGSSLALVPLLSVTPAGGLFGGVASRF